MKKFVMAGLAALVVASNSNAADIKEYHTYKESQLQQYIKSYCADLEQRTSFKECASQRQTSSVNSLCAHFDVEAAEYGALLIRASVITDDEPEITKRLYRIVELHYNTDKGVWVPIKYPVWNEELEGGGWWSGIQLWLSRKLTKPEFFEFSIPYCTDINRRK